MRIHAATLPVEALEIRPRDAYYARQKRLFALAFGVVSLVPLVALHLSASRFYEASWMERTSAELAEIARSRREIVDRFLTAQERQLATFVELYSPAELARGPGLEALFRAVGRSGVITDLGVVDGDGRHLAYTGPFAKELAGRNYAGAEWFAEVMRNGRYVSDVFTGYRNVPHIIVAVADERREWILRATIDSELLNALVTSADVGPGGDAFIVNARGELQTPSRHGHGRFDAGEMARFAALADGGRPAAAVGRSLYSAARLNGGSWLLVLETDVDASLATFQAARRRDAAIIAVAAMAVLAVAVVVTRTMVERLADADRQRAALSERMREVEKMALVGRLAASVSHEINNPLQTIAQHAGLLLEMLEDRVPPGAGRDDEYRRSLEKIREHVRRASAITHRLLGFSRAPGRERAPADVNRAVEDTIALLEAEARRHRIVIARDLQAGLAPVWTDASQLQQVFLNVLGNAMDAIGEDGEIRVATRAEGEWLRVDFLDSGPGLPPGAARRIFDPFFTTKPEGKGTGLGLYVSHAIAGRLGGELTAANRSGGGTAFTLRIPRQDSTLQEGEPA